MSAQTAAALQLDELENTAEKGTAAAQESPESPVERALKSENPGEVIDIFRGRAAEKKKAIDLLGGLESVEVEAAPKEAGLVAAANAEAGTKITAAEELAIQKVAEVIPITRVKAPEVAEAAPEVAPVEVAAVAPVEVIQPSPMIRVGEAPNADPELIHEAEMLKAHEQEQIEAERKALDEFSKDHGLTLDIPNLNSDNVEELDLKGLTPLERLYLYTIVKGYTAANTSLRHAEMLLAAYAIPASDPQRAELMAAAQTLLEQAQVHEIGAQVLKNEYMEHPEIKALIGGTGGSMGGGFDGGEPPEKPPEIILADSPYAKGPKKPQPQPSNVLGFGGVSGHGIADVKAYTEGSTPVTKKPSLIDRWFRKNVSDLTGGAVDSTKSSRE